MVHGSMQEETSEEEKGRRRQRQREGKKRNREWSGVGWYVRSQWAVLRGESVGGG